MPVQKTFTLVPTISRDASPMPAFAGGRMTSKQVKQAYKAANQGPRLSRAEQIKADRAEQARIRKEIEKEKASAKARLVRERKKEKELAEREVKKKEGKPLVNVRPSQDTIARFVRGSGNGAGKKRDYTGSCVDRRRDGAADGTASTTTDSTFTHDLLDAIVEEEEEESQDQPIAKDSSQEGANDQNDAGVDELGGKEDSKTVLVDLSIGDIPSDSFDGSDSAHSPHQEGSQNARTAKPAAAGMLKNDKSDLLGQDVEQETAQLAVDGLRQEQKSQQDVGVRNSQADDRQDSNVILAEISTGDIPSEFFDGSESASVLSQASKSKSNSHHDDTVVGLLDEELHTDLSQDAAAASPCRRSSRVSEQVLPAKEPEVDDYLDGELDSDVLDELVVIMDESRNANPPLLDDLKGSRGFRPAQSGACTPQLLLRNRGASQKREEHDQEEAEPATSTPESPAPSRGCRGSRAPMSPASIQQCPPLGTQAIMMNMDDFFPTASQQARELEFDTDDLESLLSSLPARQAMPPPATPARAPPEVSSKTPQSTTTAVAMVRMQPSPKARTPQSKQSPSPSPRPPERWFTASGSKELNSLAIQRSKRSAALEEIQQRERIRAGQWRPVVRQTQQAGGGTRSLDGVPPQGSSERQDEGFPPKRSCRSLEGSENTLPPPELSQETDYGGGWMEDFEF